MGVDRLCPGNAQLGKLPKVKQLLWQDKLVYMHIQQVPE